MDGFAALSGPGLVRVVQGAARLKRSVEAFLALAGAEVAARSAPEFGAESLAKQYGHSSPAKLVAAVTGGGQGEASRLLAVGEATRQRESFTGEVLPAKFAHVRAGLDAGVLSIEAANLITGMLARVELRTDPGRLAAAEERLVQVAAGQPLSLVGRAVKVAEAQLNAGGLARADARMHAERSVTFREDADGVFHLRARLDPVTAAPVKAALDALVSDALRRRGSGRAAAAGAARAAQVGRGTDAAEVYTRDRIRGMNGAPGTSFDGDDVVGGGGGVTNGVGVGRGVGRGGGGGDGRSGTSGATSGGGLGGAGAPGTVGGGGPSGGGGTNGGGSGGDGRGAAPVIQDRRSIPQVQADALAELARHALGCQAAPGSVPATTIVVRMSLDALRDGVGTAEIDGIDRPISAGAVRKLAADAELIPAVLGADSVPLDLGRGTRLFTRYQRIALMERDGGCASCGANITYAEAHHIDWWSAGGTTDLSNGVMLCASCHHQIHDQGWQIRITGRDRRGQVWFIPPPHLDPKQTPKLGGKARFTPTPGAPPQPDAAPATEPRGRPNGSNRSDGSDGSDHVRRTRPATANTRATSRNRRARPAIESR